MLHAFGDTLRSCWNRKAWEPLTQGSNGVRLAHVVVLLVMLDESSFREPFGDKRVALIPFRITRPYRVTTICYALRVANISGCVGCNPRWVRVAIAAACANSDRHCAAGYSYGRRLSSAACESLPPHPALPAQDLAKDE